MKILLSLLDEGRALSQREMAEELNISVETMAAQIEYLEQIGMLRRIGNDCGCSGACKGCASKCQDSGISPPLMWEKTF